MANTSEKKIKNRKINFLDRCEIECFKPGISIGNADSAQRADEIIDNQ